MIQCSYSILFIPQHPRIQRVGNQSLRILVSLCFITNIIIARLGDKRSQASKNYCNLQQAKQVGARKLVFFWHQSEDRTASTVWNWSGKTLSPGALLTVLYFSFVPYFSACLDFPSPPLSAPGSPRMGIAKCVYGSPLHSHQLQVQVYCQWCIVITYLAQKLLEMFEDFLVHI